MAQLKDLIVNGASRLIGDVYISGDATADTPASGSNDTKVATTAFVKTAVDNAINNAKQTKTVTPATYAQNVDPDSGKILSRVTVDAIPNQKSDSGNVYLGVNGSKSYPAGYYLNAHGASQGIDAGSVIDSAGGNIPTRSGLSKSGGTVSGYAGYYPTAPSAYVTADDVTSGYAYFSSSEGDQDQNVTSYQRVYIYGVGSGYVGSGIPRYPGVSKKLTSGDTSVWVDAGQYLNSYVYAYVDVYNGEWG